VTDTYRLLGLDPEDPEVQAASEDAEALMDLVAALVRQREAAGLSREQVAGRMHTSVAAVAGFERLGGDPLLSEVQRYARAVGRRSVIGLA